jgi:microcystin-dependent protein
MPLTNITYPTTQPMPDFYQTLKDAITAINLFDAGTVGQVFKKTGSGFLEGEWTEIYEDQTGDIKMTASTTSGSGYLICNGSLKNIADYPALFAVISNTFGGDGITTFRVPDMRGRVPLGVGTLSNPDARETLSPATYALGDQVGVSRFVQTIAEMPSHSHGIDLSDNEAINGNRPSASVFLPVSNTGSTEQKGDSESQENRQPSLAINFKIKT